LSSGVPAGRYAGRTAIVTGGGAGIGRATVRRLHGEGAAVVIADVNESSGTTLADELGSRARFAPCDVSSAQGWAAAMAAAIELGGGVDALVINAAYQEAAEPTERLDDSDGQRITSADAGGRGT